MHVADLALNEKSRNEQNPSSKAVTNGIGSKHIQPPQLVSVPVAICHKFQLKCLAMPSYLSNNEPFLK